MMKKSFLFFELLTFIFQFYSYRVITPFHVEYMNLL